MLRAACYDLENRMYSETASDGSTATYAYDGDGRRVQKTAYGKTTVYVYDAFGQLASEAGSGSDTDASTQYVTPDALGSTRLVTNASGGQVMCYDYMPFGGDLGNGVDGRGTCFESVAYPSTSADILNQKFTGKERDAETGLDFFGARYFSGAQGRFTSPDAPFADQHPEDPQSWNMYAYVRNNPLKNADPDGRDCFTSVSSCANYILGGAIAVGNAATSGLPNSPATLTNLVISPFTSYRFRLLSGDADGFRLRDSLRPLVHEAATFIGWQDCDAKLVSAQPIETAVLKQW